MTSTNCQTCGNSGMIAVDEHVFVRTVTYRKLLEGSDELLSYEDTVIDKTGGVAACPDCAYLAEATWQSNE